MSVRSIRPSNTWDESGRSLLSSNPGITAKVLSARLKELEEEGLVKKRVEAGSVPVRSEYTLTGSGLGLVEVIKEIKRWALRWKIENLACGAQDCHDCML